MEKENTIMQLSKAITIFSIVITSSSYASSWSFSSNIDSFNDRVEAKAYAFSDRKKGRAIVRCSAQGKLDVIFDFESYIASRSPIISDYRIDNKPTLKYREWSVSTEGTAVFASDGIDSFKLAKEMQKGSKIQIKSKDYRGTNHILRFSLKGSNEAIQKVLDVCGIDKEYFKKLGIH